jgi:hypothetical protein
VERKVLDDFPPLSSFLALNRDKNSGRKEAAMRLLFEHEVEGALLIGIFNGKDDLEKFVNERLRTNESFMVGASDVSSFLANYTSIVKPENEFVIKSWRGENPEWAWHQMPRDKMSRMVHTQQDGNYAWHELFIVIHKNETYIYDPGYYMLCVAN